jgi:DNA-directed RNA polymerase specialized sigma24 family protein
VLRYYDDLAVRDVAVVLGCTEGTVKSQTARGLETLQAAFARETNDDLLVSGRE